LIAGELPTVGHTYRAQLRLLREARDLVSAGTLAPALRALLEQVRDGDAPVRRAARPLVGVVLRVAGRNPEMSALRREAATLL
jgi:hypothetical protein